MRKRRSFLLFLIALAIMAAFFALPQNRDWALKVYGYARDFNRQRHRLSHEQRMAARFSRDYIYSKGIADFFERKGIRQQVLLLMPPNSYVKAAGIDYHVPEPAVFYYFTGLKTVWADSDSAYKADWYARVVNGKIIVDSVANPRALRDTILAYRKMGVSL